ncbi:MAG TPA: ThuA domain-containing protein, partial [Lacipirellulaceae bacterium]
MMAKAIRRFWCSNQLPNAQHRGDGNMNVTSERKHSQTFVMALLLSLFGALLAPAPAPSVAQQQTATESSAQEKSPDHRLIFLGDRGPHRPQIRANAFIPVMRERGIAIEYTEDPNILTSPKLAEYDGLILYANIDEITPEQDAGLLAFVEGGKGFVPLHCASFCFRNSEKFVDLIGAQFLRHGAEVF